MLGQIFAAEVLEHAGLDPRVVALKVEQRLHEVNIDGAEPVVDDDRVGQLADKVVDARAGPARPRGAGSVAHAVHLGMVSANALDSRISPSVSD